ncbi:hypothetical protein M8C21_014302 [Ambrosia artemisiifolia]|uniref:Uncharacterized protein n=1 Tax=Ambrosia artemisiifolia TaxID=4212 RepID=A0AAD5GIY6_AMBAR|nr:hypothetical protein M8C21_014302 [Ambrosia artemisiifolia]
MGVWEILCSGQQQVVKDLSNVVGIAPKDKVTVYDLLVFVANWRSKCAFSNMLFVFRQPTAALPGTPATFGLPSPKIVSSTQVV